MCFNSFINFKHISYLLYKKKDYICIEYKIPMRKILNHPLFPFSIWWNDDFFTKEWLNGNCWPTMLNAVISAIVILVPIILCYSK